MPLALPIWTLLIWATRVRNVVADGGGPAELIVPGVLTLLAVAALLDRRRGLLALAGVTIAVWAVRLPLVLVRDHAAAFKVVHAVLAVVSVILAVLAWRAAGAGPTSVPAGVRRRARLR